MRSGCRLTGRVMPKFCVILSVFLCFLPAASTCAQDTVLHTNVERTDANLFLPAGVKVIRGVLINPADKKVGPGSVWDESCRHWGFAHLGLMLEEVDKRNNRPSTLRKVIDAALKEFAEKSGHAELVTAPFVFGGMSKGGGWSAELGQGYAARTIAFNNVCGWVGKPDKDLSMPAVIVIGGIPDGFKMLDAVGTQYEPARKKGAAWCLAIQWGNAHNYSNANALAFPFLDAVITSRLPRDANPADGPVKLKDMKPEDGWLGDGATWESTHATIAAYGEFKGDKERAVWLPNRYVAFAWRSFVSKDPPVQLDVATADGKLKAASFTPTAKRSLIVPRGSAVTLTAYAGSGTAFQKVSFYDGDHLLGESNAAPFAFTWQNIPDGPRAVFIAYTTGDGNVGYSNPVLVLASPAPLTSPAE